MLIIKSKQESLDCFVNTKTQKWYNTNTIYSPGDSALIVNLNNKTITCRFVR